MVFHLGVLRFLAEKELLERVSRISTVSGGSLLVGLMLHKNGLRWPSSKIFLDSVFPTLRQQLCERSLQWGAARQLVNPINLRFIFSRANLLALALKNEWGIVAKLSDMHTFPDWSINGTTAETGKRFRFKQTDMGDYTLGYASVDNFPLASALAVSAAFPGGFGPLQVDTTRHQWAKRPSWGAPKDSEIATDVAHTALHLYDGGVYDNLGLEPFFDAGRSKSKHPDTLIIASDAGAPLGTGFSHVALNPWRFKRVVDIISDQSRALRVRAFTNYLQQKNGGGALIYIGSPVVDTARRASAEFAMTFPTTLRRLTTDEFDALADHGYQVAWDVEREYGLTTSAQRPHQALSN